MNINWPVDWLVVSCYVSWSSCFINGFSSLPLHRLRPLQHLCEYTQWLLSQLLLLHQILLHYPIQIQLRLSLVPNPHCIVLDTVVPCPHSLFRGVDRGQVDMTILESLLISVSRWRGGVLLRLELITNTNNLPGEGHHRLAEGVFDLKKLRPIITPHLQVPFIPEHPFLRPPKIINLKYNIIPILRFNHRRVSLLIGLFRLVAYFNRVGEIGCWLDLSAFELPKDELLWAGLLCLRLGVLFEQCGNRCLEGLVEGLGLLADGLQTELELVRQHRVYLIHLQ